MQMNSYILKFSFSVQIYGAYIFSARNYQYIVNSAQH